MVTHAPSLPKTFKAIQWTTTGTPSQVISMNEELPLPAVTGSNILVKVHASALNPVDWKFMKGGVFLKFLPKIRVPCLDIAGTVVAIGPNATGKFQVGDEVMAMLDFRQSGGLAEYTLAEESIVVKKPQRWSFEQAAAWPLVASTVWGALVDYANLKKGDKVLIIGASGGAGTVAVQLVKALGAYVVGVCSAANAQLVKDIGADEVVDYNTTDVTEKYTNKDFDIVFDAVGPATAAKIWAKRHTILKNSGNLVCIAGDEHAMDSFFQLLKSGAQIAGAKLLSFVQGGPGYHLFNNSQNGDILAKAVKVLDEDAKVDPVIDSVYEFTLPSILAAFEKSKSSRAKGKIVVKIV